MTDGVKVSDMVPRAPGVTVWVMSWQELPAPLVVVHVTEDGVVVGRLPALPVTTPQVMLVPGAEVV